MNTGQVRLPAGGHLYYEISGAGPPLLLLRPLGGSLVLWDRLRARLAQEVRVVAFDPRGCGRSSEPALLTTTRGMARDAVALLDALALPLVHVFGLSLGGMVAQWLALDAPGRVGGLVLASTAARGLDLSRHGVVRGLRLARCLLRSPRQAEACLVRRVLSHTFRREHPAEVARLAALAQAQPASRLGILAQAGAAASHDTHARLGALRARTLVLLGARDGLLRHESIAALAAAVPGARLETLDGGHDLSLEAPEATAASILAFLRRG